MNDPKSCAPAPAWKAKPSIGFNPYWILGPLAHQLPGAPFELRSFDAFDKGLTAIFGDPNMAATAEGKPRQFKQTGSVGLCNKV